MCGIAAIYNYSQSAACVDVNELHTIRDHMIARGPDGEGSWLSADGKVGLAHRRLAIIDLSDDAAQPMISNQGRSQSDAAPVTRDGQLVITFNGEIYNYRALREALIQKGYQFKSQSDTEVLLQLYRDKGESMVHDLRGMFAFAIWDADKRGLFMARDPYGIKPLYYADDGQSMRVASQVKALLASGQVSEEKDAAGIVGFYLLGSVPEPFTTYTAIKALPAGCTLWATGDGVEEPVQYASIADAWSEAEMHPQAHDTIQQALRDALLDSVKHHMVSDVPVGAFLSAGVDSGALVGLMRELAPETAIQTVTLAFEEFEGQHEDESQLAEQVAKQYGTKHSRRVVTREEFETDLPKIHAAMDQPSIDGINSWFVSKAAKELGIKVAISGLGGDELFGGYPAFRDVPRWQRLFHIPSRIPLLGDLVTGCGQLLPRSIINPKALGMVKYGGTYAGAWLLRRGIYMPWELKSILPSELVTQGLQRLNLVAKTNAMLKQTLKQPFSKVATLESSLYMRNQLLRDSDWAGMAHSLEIRVPLVDFSLLKTLAPLLLSQKQIKGKEWLGKSPATPLPNMIIDRAKTGFTTPMRSWLLSTSEQGDANRDKQHNQHWSRRWVQQLATEFGLD